jgi:hypothetical protein
MIAVGALLVVLAGCGSSGSSAATGDIAKVAQSVSNGSTITKEQATCVAQKSVPKISAKDRAELEKKSADLTKLTKADQGQVWTAFSACITVAQLAPSIAESVEAPGKKVAAKTADCYKAALGSTYTKSGDVMKALVDHSQTLVKALTKCISPTAVKQALVNALSSSDGLTQAQATCVVDKLVGSMSSADLSKLLASGPASADVQAKLQADASACASAS